jgi:acyl-CoA synthetase (AMP-forming)/AMP-acid ligase II
VASLDALLGSAARRFPERPALTLHGHQLTYRALLAAVDRLAGQLAREGITAGLRVGVLAPNSPALVAGLFAAWRLGAVAVPLNARWREYEIGGTLRDAEAACLVAVESYRGYSFVDLLARLLPELPAMRACHFVDAAATPTRRLPGQHHTEAESVADGIALLLYTSGTTGAPKGALIRQAAEVRGAEEMNTVLGAEPGDVCALAIPATHSFGLSCALAALAAGSHLVMVDSTFSLEPLSEAIRGHAATVLHGSPALFATLAKAAQLAPGSLRAGFVAGSTCPPALIERLDGTGLRLMNLYGMTELGPAACVRRDDPPALRYHSVGAPMAGYEFRIDGRAGGEVLARGPCLMAGYYRQPQETAAALEDGWFRTGDLGSLDGGGHLRISGRAKEVVSVGGLSVFPAEVEGFLLTHPDVLQAAVIGVAHETMGETLEAFIVERPGSGLTPAAVLQYARERIAGYKLPYAIRLVPELPLLASGKPDRAALRRWVEEEGRGERRTGAHAAV